MGWRNAANFGLAEEQGDAGGVAKARHAGASYVTKGLTQCHSGVWSFS